MDAGKPTPTSRSVLQPQEEALESALRSAGDLELPAADRLRNPVDGDDVTPDDDRSPFGACREVREGSSRIRLERQQEHGATP